MFSVGLKKEWLAFFRTKRFLWLIIIVAVMAIASPLMLKFALSTDEMYEQLGIDNPPSQIIMQTSGGDMLGYSMVMAESNTVSACFIALSILLIPVAGGEQKKRSVTIPDCAGLTPFNYVAPKFLIFPLIAFLIPFFCSTICYGASAIIFSEMTTSITFSNVLAESALSGLFLVFLVTLQLFAGIASSNGGGISLAIILGNMFLPQILSSGINYYNPFALSTFGQLQYMKGMSVEMGGMWKPTPSNFYGSIAITAALSLIFFFASWFFKTAGKIDNSDGDEVSLL